nr:MAG TPA: hypothetical protein [Caudoviricetes sp.]
MAHCHGRRLTTYVEHIWHILVLVCWNRLLLLTDVIILV